MTDLREPVAHAHYDNLVGTVALDHESPAMRSFGADLSGWFVVGFDISQYEGGYTVFALLAVPQGDVDRAGGLDRLATGNDNRLTVTPLQVKTFGKDTDGAEIGAFISQVFKRFNMIAALQVLSGRYVIGEVIDLENVDEPA